MVVSIAIQSLKYVQIKNQTKKLEEALEYFKKNNKVQEKNENTLKKVLENFNEISSIIINDKYGKLNYGDSVGDLDLDYISFVLGNVLEQFNRSLSNYQVEEFIYNISDILERLKFYIMSYIFNNKMLLETERARLNIQDIESKMQEVTQFIQENKILSEDLRNKTIHQIYNEESKKFNNIARNYEVSFYILLMILAFYIFGYYIEFKTTFLTFKFSEHFDDSNKTAFYIQKISLIILSSTLAAFFLKRSYMNRRLADEAYRTAKEIDGLPRYTNGLPDEMKEKIRFDLAYKYFGNGIHHDSYTGGENLMHENIKANTEFMKIVKGVPSTTDESKADKDKNE